MIRKTSISSLLGLMMVLLRCAPMFAGGGDEQGVGARPFNENGTIYTIYSNLGPPGDQYDDQRGWYVRGPHSGKGQQWMAVAFVPKSDAEVTKVEVAIEYQAGTNGVTVALNEDSGNVSPGRPLYTWNLTHLPDFGSCCKLEIAKAKQPVNVKRGLIYWIVARTGNRTQDTEDPWTLEYQDSTGTIAYDTGSGWGSSINYTVAVGVFGNKLK